MTRKGEKLIKSGYDTCQFLGEDRRCTVYSARPRDCREYVCWDQHDSTVYDFAYFYQKAIGAQRRAEAKRDAEAARRKRAAPAKSGAGNARGGDRGAHRRCDILPQRAALMP